ncbi:MAG: hypothetical protein LH702_09630, partial [Phormidesmis sp. CAN_BIN44]|nr:hypothetical protein [Phormidesmis sp. CAN_BIN44]
MVFRVSLVKLKYESAFNLEKAIVKVFLLAIISCVASALLLSTAAFGQTPPQVNQPTATTREA